MKKIVIILAIYTVLIFIGCLILSLFIPLPELVVGVKGLFRFNRALLWFLTTLPAIFISGFTVACSVNWRKNTENSRNRFSAAMLERYRNVMFISIGLLLFLMLNAEIFHPIVSSFITSMKRAPAELEIALKKADYFINTKYEPEVAYQYAKKAVAIAPKDERAIDVFKEVKDELEMHHNNRNYSGDKKNVNPVIDETDSYMSNYTVDFLLKSSKDCALREEWFNSHFWAALAINAIENGNGEEIRLNEANALANSAWEKLKEPRGEDTKEENEYFRKKKEAYDALVRKDNLEAYYKFLALSKSSVAHAADPEIVNFLAQAERNVKNESFFIDETDDIKQRANAKDIHFSLLNEDGSRSVYFIEGIMDMKEGVTSVRYLDDFTVIDFDREGNFVKKMYVPIAKVTALPTDSEEVKSGLRIKEDWKSVPFIKLQAVDRQTKGVATGPIFSYSQTGIPEEIAKSAGFMKIGENEIVTEDEDKSEELRYLILPMPYSDFLIIQDASAGAERMNLLSLHRFLSRASNYGFSSEIFLKSLVSRVMYPLMLLIIFVFAAVLGWNYRIEGSKGLFKFRWLFLIPLFSVITYIGLEIVMYVFDTVNYVIVGMCGISGIAVSAIVYIILLAILSVIFISRKK